MRFSLPAFASRIKQRFSDHSAERDWRAALRAWRADNPGSEYALFYAWYAQQRIRANRRPPRMLGSGINVRFQRRRAIALRDMLIDLGLRPDHAVIDYGCGSLWVGGALLEYLAPGRYTGLDVVDDFYTEALARLGPALIADKRPELGLIGAARDFGPTSARPDFIVSTAVLLHVPPEDLGCYFQRLVALAGPDTRILIEHDIDLGDGFRGMVWRHGRETIGPCLAARGYEIAPTTHQRRVDGYKYRLGLFEIAPGLKCGRRFAGQGLAPIAHDGRSGAAIGG